MAVSKLVVDIDLPAERFIALYQGSVRQVQVSSIDGRKVRFPGECLKRFVTHYGVQGRFEISFDEQRRFQAIRRL